MQEDDAVATYDDESMDLGFDLNEELARAGFCFDGDKLEHTNDILHASTSIEPVPIPTEPTMVYAVQCTRCLLFHEPSLIQSCEGMKNYGCHAKWCSLCFTSVFRSSLQPFGCGCCPSKRTKRGRKANNDIDMREINSPTLVSSMKMSHGTTSHQNDDRLDRLEKMIIHLNKRLDDIVQIYQTRDSDSE